MNFVLDEKDLLTRARAGKIETAHGVIETPIFMPVGTSGVVKTVHQKELKEEIKAQIILGNTYHLYLRPNLEILHFAGGLHKFMNWDGPILTDSGGYQVFSLTHRRKIKEEGVYFSSHIDGNKLFFTPENVIDTQRIIGADILMVFDECTPYPCKYEYAKTSMELTHRWLDRCIARFDGTKPKYGFKQSLFPIVQGSVYKDLRKKSAEYIASKNRSGNAIGGLSVGEPEKHLYETTKAVCEVLPEDKPRYLMGVGTPENILEAIALGVDMFDCVMPTRNARNGMLFTTQGTINIKNAKWKRDLSSIDLQLEGYASNFYSKAYLRHLIMSKEMLGAHIASVHNLTFYLWLVKKARQHILQGDFKSWKDKMIPQISRRL